MKLTLLCLYKQLILEEMLKNETNMQDVLFSGLKKKKNEYVIYGDKQELIEHDTEHVINQHLEDCGCIGQAEWHN